MDLPTCIIRHRRENLKKCSLRGLEGRKEMQFFCYPECMDGFGDFSGYVLLDLDGPPLSIADSHFGLILVDATWRLAQKMVKHSALEHLPKRSIPSGFQTTYPLR